MTKVLVVCMGNICRSPTGEAVMKAKAEQLGVSVEVDSAGTIDYHQGGRPDERARVAGEKRGYSFSGMRARKVLDSDFENFDYILVADKANLTDLQQRCPEHLQHKLALFMSYSDSVYDEIPDPYYGGERGFELVLDLIEHASEQFLLSLK